MRVSFYLQYIHNHDQQSTYTEAIIERGGGEEERRGGGEEKGTNIKPMFKKN